MNKYFNEFSIQIKPIIIISILGIPSSDYKIRIEYDGMVENLFCVCIF